MFNAPRRWPFAPRQKLRNYPDSLVVPTSAFSAGVWILKVVGGCSNLHGVSRVTTGSAKKPINVSTTAHRGFPYVLAHGLSHSEVLSATMTQFE